MSDETNYLMQQAKEQARKEFIKNFFYKNGKTITRIVMGLLVAIIVILIWNSIHNSRKAKFSEIFHQSLIYQQLGDEDKSRAELQKIYDAKYAPSGVRSLASLRLAAILYNEGNRSEANKIYAEVSKCGSCDQYVKDLAGLLLVKNWMADVNEVSSSDIVERVEKIENSNKVLKFYITEQRAFLEAKKGDFKKSQQILELIIKSPEAAKALKERAENEMKILDEKTGGQKLESESSEEKK